MTLQPGIRSLLHAATDHSACTAPPGCPARTGTRVADAPDAPWGIRQQRRLPEVFAPAPDAPGQLTRRIADVVNGLGLQPWRPPEPLDPIEEDEVNLVVWMGSLEALH